MTDQEVEPTEEKERPPPKEKARRIHAIGDKLMVVRYEPGAHWYIEATSGGGLRRYDTIEMNSQGKTDRLNSFRRKQTTVVEAVDCSIANDLRHIEGVEGGGAFDKLMRLSRPAVGSE